MRISDWSSDVCSSDLVFSQQIDVIIHDRQYSPFVFTFKGTDVVPAESVYAVFEAKQELTADYIRYAGEKAASVRRLHRTSLSAETIDGPSRAKPPHHILAGIIPLSAGRRSEERRVGKE